MLALLTRSPRLCAAWLLPLIFLASTASAGAAADPVFSGTVRDSVGNRLSGVEILLVTVSTVTRPAAIVSSDPHGGFSITGLAPGLYRIAALKPGYLTHVGQVNTRLETWIELILHPAAASEDENGRPTNAAWAMRLPRRGILRQTEATPRGEPEAVTVGAEPAEEPSRPASRARSGALGMQVDHLVGMPGDLPSWDHDGGTTRGSETRMRLDSLVGQRAAIRVNGRHEKVQGSSGQAVDPITAQRQAAALGLAFSYDASLDTTVAVNAYYSRRDLEWSAGAPEPQSQARSAWGYGATWSKQLDPASRVDLSLEYQNRSLRLPGQGVATTPESVEKALSDRSLGAVGSYEIVPDADHQVRVEFSARLLQAPLPALASVEAVLGDVSGFSVGIQADDTWQVAGPFAVIYGLGYKHTITARDASLIVPRFGGTYRHDRIAVRLLVSYHAIEDWTGESGPTLVAPFRLEQPVGYQVDVELPLTYGLTAMASTSSSPIQFDFDAPGELALEPDRAPLFWSDGNVAVDELRFTLTKDAGNMQMYVEATEGIAEGTLSAVMPFDTSFRYLSDRSLNYRKGRIGVRHVPAGTDLFLEYRRIEESSGGDPTLSRESLQRSVELRLMQDILRLQAAGNWRFLVAVRMATLDAGGRNGAGEDDGEVTVSLNRQISAGLSVVF